MHSHTLSILHTYFELHKTDQTHVSEGVISQEGSGKWPQTHPLLLLTSHCYFSRRLRETPAVYVLEVRDSLLGIHSSPSHRCNGYRIYSIILPFGFFSTGHLLTNMLLLYGKLLYYVIWTITRHCWYVSGSESFLWWKAAALSAIVPDKKLSRKIIFY